MNNNERAELLAGYIARNAPNAQRGVIPYHSLHLIAVFGNDGYGRDEHQRPELEVEGVRSILNEKGMTELGFGVNYQTGTWVVLVEPFDPTPPMFLPGDERQLPEAEVDLAANHLEVKLWESWNAVNEAPGTDLHQYIVAQRAIARLLK
jgi:hypothetical protein